MKRKIMLALIALLTVCLAVSAVSAWEFSFGSESSSSTSVGTDGSASVDYKDGVLKINDKEFKIPEGYTQDINGTLTGESANITGMDDAKMSRAMFTNGDKVIAIKYISANGDMTFKPTTDTAQNKTIGGHDGVLETEQGGVFFSYLESGKLIQIDAPDEATINEILK